MRAEVATKMSTDFPSDIGQVGQVGQVRREPCAAQAPHYHFAGVGGIGMSGLAQLLLWNGARVSGSDRCRDAGRPLEALDRLERAGVKILPQDGSGVQAETSALVVSSAVESDNRDVRRAEELHIPVLHRAEMLARTLDGLRCVAVTGTSGKSTVTGMLGWTMTGLAADPTVICGAAVVGWEAPDRVGNALPGSSDLCVFEADESDRSLLRYSPDWVVVTNVSLDHFSVAEARRLFDRFAEKARDGVVDFDADPSLLDGFRPDLLSEGSRFEYGGVSFSIGLPGRHNAENAMMAVRVCERMGYPLGAIRDALASFRGLRRRMETVGTPGRGIRVVDDYAHNPEKIKAAWQAMAASHGRVVGVLRPHGYGPLRHMRETLVSVLVNGMRSADSLILLPVYDAGGTADRSEGAEVFHRMLCRRDCRVTFVRGYDEAVAALLTEVGPGDAVLVMGARDPELPLFARRVAAALGQQAGCPVVGESDGSA